MKINGGQKLKLKHWIWNINRSVFCHIYEYNYISLALLKEQEILIIKTAGHASWKNSLRSVTSIRTLQPPASAFSSSFHYGVLLQLFPHRLLHYFWFPLPLLAPCCFGYQWLPQMPSFPLSITRAVIVSHSCTAAGHARASHLSNRWLHIIFHQQEVQQEAHISHPFTQGQAGCEGLYTHFHP